jgi:ribosomal protein L37AE/L43A
MESEHRYPIETFDPLLRDLVAWGLVDRQDGDTGEAWKLVPAAQRRLDELLSPTRLPGAGADVYLDRRCADCQHRGLTRLHEEIYVCDSCWAERQGPLDAEVIPPSPVEQTHRWRRSRQRQATTLAS